MTTEQQGAGIVPAPAPNLMDVPPAQMLSEFKSVIEAVGQLIKDNKWEVTINKSKHLRIEGWTCLGSIFGVYPVTEATRRLSHDEGDGWEAVVKAQTRAGEVVGRAVSMCTRLEANWRTRDDHALRAMAQTRAASKALSSSLRFVATMAGYSGTPAEEMPQYTKEEISEYSS